jgi:Tyrosine phosphatase family
MDLEPMDPAYVADILSRPPFVTINGVHNIRDLGFYPSSYGDQITKPNFVFRSAEISGITEEGASGPGTTA